MAFNGNKLQRSDEARRGRHKMHSKNNILTSEI